MKLAHVADLHFGANFPQVMSAAQDAIRSLAPAILIVSGDLTQRGKSSEFVQARRWIDELALPTLAVPGNHDTPLLDLHARVARPFARFDSYLGDLAGPLKRGHVQIHGLNTARGWQARRNWAEGSVRLIDLEAALEPTPEGPVYRLLTCHHPFLSPVDAPLQTSTRRGRAASQKLAKSEFQILLTGHLHTPHVEEISEIGGRYLAVSAGTLSTRLRRSPPSFNVIELQNKNVSITPMTFTHDGFVPGSIRTFKLQIPGPKGGERAL